MIPFVKAHACGNDFLIIQEELAGSEPRERLARRLCCRNQGVGADGIEFFTPRTEDGGQIRLYNADGSIAEISGNGTRCAAAWLAREKHIDAGGRMVLETDAGIRVCEIVSRTGYRFQIASSMGIPEIDERTVDLADGEKIAGAVVSTGNPHFVVFVDGPEFTAQGRPWGELGREICNHPAFPRQTNVEFVRVISRDEIEIRIFERGVGPTASSGTGTCASATAAIELRGAARTLQVKAPGGTQTVEWPGSQAELRLTGPAELICSGEAF